MGDEDEALIEINIQIRAIEAIAAIGTGDLAVHFDHLTSAAVAKIDVFLRAVFGLCFDWRFFHRRSILETMIQTIAVYHFAPTVPPASGGVDGGMLNRNISNHPEWRW